MVSFRFFSQLWLNHPNPDTHHSYFSGCFFLFMACNNHLSRAEERKNEKKSGTSKGLIKLVAMALKRSNFLHTLPTPSTYVPHSPHNLHRPHFVNYLYCLVLWFFDDDFFISFAPFEAPQRALRQLCAKRGRARGKESDREGERAVN